MQENKITHSRSYERLSKEQQDTADAIMGFLNGENTLSTERILYALLDEIKIISTIGNPLEH